MSETNDEIVYVIAWTGGYEDPAITVKKTLEEAELVGREWRDEISRKNLDEVRVLKFNLTQGTEEIVVSYWYNEDHEGIVETRK